MTPRKNERIARISISSFHKRVFELSTQPEGLVGTMARYLPHACWPLRLFLVGPGRCVFGLVEFTTYKGKLLSISVIALRA